MLCTCVRLRSISDSRRSATGDTRRAAEGQRESANTFERCQIETVLARDELANLFTYLHLQLRPAALEISQFRLETLE